MSAIRLPKLDIQVLQNQLRDDYQNEVPILRWKGETFIQVSVQGYKDQADAGALMAALEDLLQ